MKQRPTDSTAEDANPAKESRNPTRVLSVLCVFGGFSVSGT
jgi:hypothetical protein